jgi:hypothetical protein
MNCSTCKAWRPLPNKSYGRCVAEPPRLVHVPVGQTKTAAWPVTYSGDDCMAHKPIPGTAPPHRGKVEGR